MERNTELIVIVSRNLRKFRHWNRILLTELLVVRRIA